MSHIPPTRVFTHVWGKPAGTMPQYNSPEALIANGQVYVHAPTGALRQVTLKSDVFTVAYVLVEVLQAGRRVFDDELHAFQHDGSRPSVKLF